MVAGLGTVLVLYAGGQGLSTGECGQGDWYLFLQSVALFWFPLTSIASFWSQFQQGLSAAERVFALIDATPRVVQEREDPVGELSGGIVFEGVDFAYVEGQPVLRDFGLEIVPGELIAVVGHTGAGKSTLGKLIARFYEFQGGVIRLDGRSIRIRPACVAQIARRCAADAVPVFGHGGRQHPVSPAGRQPLGRRGGGKPDRRRRLGRCPAQRSRHESRRAGQGLSMGQRQLVALARLLIQNPPIVILDEATASVDPLTEAQIQEGLDEVLAGRTAIVIAHRLVTVRHADRIIVMRQGQIVEEGNHDQLMASGGHYAELYDTYFRHQSPDYRPDEPHRARRGDDIANLSSVPVHANIPP